MTKELEPLVKDLVLPEEWRKDVQTKKPDFETTVRAIRRGTGTGAGRHDAGEGQREPCEGNRGVDRDDGP